MSPSLCFICALGFIAAAIATGLAGAFQATAVTGGYALLLVFLAVRGADAAASSKCEEASGPTLTSSEIVLKDNSHTP